MSNEQQTSKERVSELISYWESCDPGDETFIREDILRDTIALLKSESVPSKERVYAVCEYLRGKPCSRCSSSVDTPYGKGVQGCYAVAEETIAVVERTRTTDEPETALDDHSELLKKLPNVHPDLVAELEKLSKWALVRRVLIQADWLGSYSKCLDGLDLRVGVDGCWNPRDIRAAVEKLRAAEPPPAVDVAPIAKLTVRDGLVQRAGLYAPGLPDGDHDVFPVPISPKGELRPHVLAEPPTASREQQLLTELAYWKARCGVMHGDETNAVTKNSVEPEPEGRGVRDNPPPHASSSSEGADTHSRLSESDAANVAKPHDDPTAHRVADLRAQPQQPAVTKNSCHCPAKPGEDCPLTLEQCDARVAGETKGGQS